MAIPSEVQGHLQKTVEQWLRRNPSPNPQDVQDMANRLYDMARPETRSVRGDYMRIVNQTINMFNSAEALRDAPDMRGTGLPTSGAIEPGQGRYFYYVLVSGRNIDGEEVYSTAVTIESDSLLTANELHRMAINAAIPGQSNYAEELHGRQINYYQTYVLLAGQRAR